MGKGHHRYGYGYNVRYPWVYPCLCLLGADHTPIIMALELEVQKMVMYVLYNFRVVTWNQFREELEIRLVSGFVPFNTLPSELNLSSKLSLHHPTDPTIQAYVIG